MSFLSKSGVNRFLNNLKSLFALKSDIPDWKLISDVTIGPTVYRTFWSVIPTSSNQVYGIAFHPSNGQPYRIYNNNGVYSAAALFADPMTTAEIDAAIVDAGDVPDSSWDQVDYGAMSTSEIDAAIAAAE